MQQLTQSIHKALSENKVTRARDLWTCCSDELYKLSVLQYLDIGTGTGYNAVTFGANCGEIIGLDLKLFAGNPLKKLSSAHLIIGDGDNLPIDNSQFDMVTAFSVIEHVPNPKLLLKEAFRVLKTNGILIIQIPDRFFPIELHTGLPLVYYMPKRILNFALKNTPFSWLKYIDIPSLKKILSDIHEAEPAAQVTVKKMNYSSLVVPANVRPIYNFASQIGILKLIPLGYIIICKKK